ncbi:MAG: ATP-binding protein [Planctomycetota bacterium]
MTTPPARAFSPRTLPVWLRVGVVLITAQAVMLLGLGWYSAHRMIVVSDTQEQRVLNEQLLKRQTVYAPLWRAGGHQELEEMLGADAALLGGRMVLIDQDAERVIFDTSGGRPLPVPLDELVLDPDARQIDGWPAHRSARERWLAVGRPLVGDTGPTLWIFHPVSNLRAAIELLKWELTSAALATLLLLGMLAGVVLKLVSRTIDRLARGAAQFAKGQLALRITPPPGRELIELTNALNDMAEQLDRRLTQLDAQRSQQEAVLQSMQGGLIAVDHHRRIVSLNRTAQRLLELRSGVIGTPIEEVARRPAIVRFIADVLAERRSLTRQLEVPGEPPITIRATGSPLGAPDGGPAGAIVLITDITEIKRLESMRSDFAANVSHELRTPITNIKGYVETLLELETPDAETNDKFLKIIGNNVERLAAIIEDMMSLTHVERLETSSALSTADITVDSLVLAVRAQVGNELMSKVMTLDTSVPEEASLRVNERLAEQAISNLVINAVRYSPPGTEVALRAEPASLADGAPAFAIHVTDHGPGIDRHHLDRLFERFYRVDKARSREAGGTGLGLAIVKHIAIAHGGSVAVESELGQGSTFTLVLPATPLSPNTGDDGEFAFETADTDQTDSGVPGHLERS